MKVAVRVAHQAACKNASKTALASAPTTKTRNGCTCQPSYYTFHRDASKRVVKGERVRDKQTAIRSAERLQRELDEGRLGLAKPKRITYPAWVDEFEKILTASVAKGDLKPRSQRGYMESLRRAEEIIRHIDVRQIGATEVRRFDDSLAGYSAATRARHLKHLSLALSRAVDEGYADANPVPAYKRGLKLNKRIPRRGKAPFEDGELVRLWSALDDEDAPVYRYVSEFSAETGMRVGELAALDWPNVSLQGRTVKVASTWNDTDGLLLPKDGEARTIHLTPHAARVLEAWVAVVGAQDSGPVFPDPNTGSRISIRNIQRRLEKAMTEAGVPKIHPDSQKPRSFHSMRYSFSVLAQRRGYHPRLIEQTLGHATLDLSMNLYGQWTADQLAAEAARNPS